MTESQLFELAQINNKLMEISTKGDDTIAMADCITKLHNFIIKEKQNLLENTENE